MKNKNRIVLGLLAATFTGALFAAEGSETKNSISIKQLTLASAIQAAQVSIDTCRKNGFQVSASVVDHYGQVQAVLRDTSASVISVELSTRKASTAVQFRKNTTQLADLSDTAVGRSEGILMAAGGVLIKVDDMIYGAVGVSGSFGGSTDDTCATAGAQAIVEALKNDIAKSESTEAVGSETPETQK